MGVQVAVQVKAAEIVAIPDLSESDTAYLASYFLATVFPLLTPLAVDPGHPFPPVAHQALNLAVADHAYIDALRRGEEPVDARLGPDAPWLPAHRSNLGQARGR